MLCELGLSLNGHLDGGLDGLVALNGAFVLTNGLDLTKGDVLLVNLNTSGLESLLNLSSGDRTVNLARLADLDGHLDWCRSDLGCKSLGIGDELSLLVSSLKYETKGLD